jgi:hypothetical protein
MARMTQTLTNTPAGPDSDPVEVERPDPDPSGTQTRAATRTPQHSDQHPDPDSDPDSDGPSPDGTQTRTRTRTQTADPGPDKVHDLDGSGPDGTQTRTRTPAHLDRTVQVREHMTRMVSYPGGFLARRRAAGKARHRAEEIAIARGVDAELLLLEAKTERDLAADADEQPRARWEQFAAGWPQMILTIAVAIMASTGQIQYAIENGATGMIWLLGHDITPLFAPAVLDLSVAALYARGMYVAVRYKASPWLPWIAGTAIGVFSVYTNTKHEHAALLFAGASAIGVVSWMVALLLKYWNLPHVKARRSTAKPRLMTSSLVLASPRTARRAWTISRRRPIATCAAEMNKNGTTITERDLVIKAAELYNTVFDDRVLAELEELGEPPEKQMGAAARRAWERRRDLAVKRAEIVAWDAVDMMLGLQVIEREGIQVNRVTYLEPDPQPVIEPVRRKAFGASPSKALTAGGGPQPSRGKGAAPDPDGEVVIVARPPGNKYRNWMSLEEIKGLPEIDTTIRCACGSDAVGRCGETLVQHVERRGVQISAFVEVMPAWATRQEPIRKPDVAVLKLGGDATMEVVWLMNQLRTVIGRVGEAQS